MAQSQGGQAVSNTPRTDEQINGKPCTQFGILAGDSLRNASVPSEFARTIERELNEANERIKLLKSSGNELLEWVKDGTISDSNYRLLANAWQRAKENKP
jgi:hypothetical protein